MSATLYDILGVSSSASNEDIKSAYKKLAKKYHPDKNSGSSWHEEQFKRINQAYQILSNASKRRQYDSIKEYEAYQSKNPRPHVPKNQEPIKRPSYSKRPTNTTNTKKKYEITISNKKINLLVIGYYVIGILILSIYSEYRNNQKIKAQIAEALRYEKLGQYSNAISVYSGILTLEKEYSEAYERRAIAKLHLHYDINSALADFSSAISYSSNPSDTLLFKRAKCYFELHQFPLAIIDLDNILSNEESTLDSAYFYKAESNFYLINYTLSIPDYSKYISLHPTPGEAYNKRGYAYLKEKNFPKALSDYNNTIKWQRENGEHYYYRGLIKFALKDTINGCVDLTDSFLLGYSEALETKNKYCTQ